MDLSRRDFVQSAAGLAAMGLGGAAVMAQTGSETTHAKPQSAVEPRPVASGGGKGGPVLIASANGATRVNGVSACDKAMELLRQGVDPLDAIIAGINIVEDDPNDTSVGLGGLPNENGVVQLDASVMHGPTHKAGAVAALERIRNPSSVARLVMQRTDHVLIVGDGALRFALAHGFKEENLLTEESRKTWLKWKETHSQNDKWLAPEDEKGTAQRWHPVEGRDFTWGTINCCALTANGDLAGCTSTSGLSWKIPGRVGDSPIIGAGLYVDNEVGAAGSTGRGEANLQNCSSFLIVELMRGGRTPEEACRETLKRIASKCEKRLRNDKGEPAFDLKLYALRKDGVVGGASMRGDAEMAYHDGQECKKINIPGVFGA